MREALQPVCLGGDCLGGDARRDFAVVVCHNMCALRRVC
jgi:hypothetical protein